MSKQLSCRWIETKLGEICEKITDGAHLSPNSVDDGFPMASVKDLNSFGINIETCRKISQTDYKKLVRQGCQPQKDDVLIAKDGATALDTVSLVKKPLDVVLLSSVAILRPNKDKIVPLYLRYYLESIETRAYMKNAFISGAAIPRVILKDFKQAKINMPPVLIQSKIVSILSAYDDLIENNLRRIKILEEMAQNLYREWFVYFRFPSHEQTRFVDSPLGRIPEGWEVVTFTDIAEVLSGGTPKTTIPEYWNGNIPFFAPKDATAYFFVTETIKYITEIGLNKCNSKLYPPETIFITARGTVGKVILAAVDMAMNQSCYALKGKPGISQKYLFFTTLEQVEYLKKNTGGATFDTIVVDTFHRMKVIKPTIELINRFTKTVDPFVGHILNLINKNMFLRQTRDLLLPKLISGELDVSELEITLTEEVAS